MPLSTRAQGGRVSGIPLGNPDKGQLFANLYLNELDRYAKHDLGIPVLHPLHG